MIKHFPLIIQCLRASVGEVNYSCMQMDGNELLKPLLINFSKTTAVIILFLSKLLTNALLWCNETIVWRLISKMNIAHKQSLSS